MVFSSYFIFCILVAQHLHCFCFSWCLCRLFLFGGILWLFSLCFLFFFFWSMSQFWIFECVLTISVMQKKNFIYTVVFFFLNAYYPQSPLQIQIFTPPFYMYLLSWIIPICAVSLFLTYSSYGLLFLKNVCIFFTFMLYLSV